MFDAKQMVGTGFVAAPQALFRVATIHVCKYEYLTTTMYCLRFDGRTYSFSSRSISSVAVISRFAIASERDIVSSSFSLSMT